MKKIKDQISELRQSTPKHVQWLLLGAAFVVVLILLTLLLTSGDTEDVSNPDDTPTELVIKPYKNQDAALWQDGVLNWANTPVGDVREYKLQISATAPVKVLDIKRTKDIKGFANPGQTCVSLASIDAGTGCSINLKYAPTTAADAETAALSVVWRGLSEREGVEHTSQITIIMGADAPAVATPQPAPKPEPVAAPAPQPEPTPVYEPEPEYEYDDEYDYEEEIDFEPAPQVAPKIKQAVDTIAPPVSIGKVAPTPVVPAISESCSDFAFPGYNLAGLQIGWIKPERGAYYFHPFSDTECENPTGVYNPDNGIITDIDNPKKKIGTDAEHIGYSVVATGAMPSLSNPVETKTVNRARQFDTSELDMLSGGGMGSVVSKSEEDEETKRTKYIGNIPENQMIVSSMPHDRKFILRQYKPIPATIVSEILADRAALEEGLPVRATVDRNVYSDDGRTIIIPTGTLMLGYVTGEIPGPYKAIGRMNINWYQFILPNGVEFNFQSGKEPFSGDSQGRSGVPGRGSTDYMEQFLMPMLTAIVPAAVNMIAPISDAFVNQIDLDNNTVVQSGTVRSSELAKNEIITAWNQVAKKLLVDMMDNTVPPFSIAAGTRITVYSPVDLVVTCGPDGTKECAFTEYGTEMRQDWDNFRGDKSADGRAGGGRSYDYQDESYVGQARSFNWDQYCENGKVRSGAEDEIYNAGLSYSNVLFYCQSSQYKAINNAKQDAIYKNQQEQFSNYGTQSQDYGGVSGSMILGDEKYNQEILGLEYNDAGAIVNPFESVAVAEEQEAAAILTCLDGSLPDANGCCAGEIFTDMGEMGFNCCPEAGGDCFPPITAQ